jgi:hypothetical protein
MDVLGIVSVYEIVKSFSWFSVVCSVQIHIVFRTVAMIFV